MQQTNRTTYKLASHNIDFIREQGASSVPDLMAKIVEFGISILYNAMSLSVRKTVMSSCYFYWCGIK